MAMVDIVIPFVNSATRDLELTYALRGFGKNLRGVREITIIGDIPILAKRGYFRIIEKPQDRRDNLFKEREVMFKLLAACDHLNITDPFLYANDDHMLLQPFEALAFPYFHSGVKPPASARGTYLETIRNTIRELGERFVFYDVHCPILIYKDVFRRAMSRVNWSVKHGYCIKSLYGALLNPPQAHCRYDPDLKITMPGQELAELEEQIKGRPWFSVGERVFLDGQMTELLKKLYDGL